MCLACMASAALMAGSVVTTGGIVAGFIALVKVAVTIVFGQAPAAPLGGATDATVGAVRPGFPPVSSGSPQPLAISSRNEMKQIVSALYLRMSIALLVRCAAEAPPVSRNAIG